MATKINCSIAQKNLGGEGCKQEIGRIVRLGFQNLRDSTGALNGFTFDTDVTETMFTDAVQNIDSSKRIFLTDLVYTPEFMRADPNYETIDNQKFFASAGEKTFKAHVIRTDRAALAQYDSLRYCDGVYLIMDNGGITAKLNGNLMTPRKINVESFNVKEIEANSSTVYKLEITFSLAYTERDVDAFDFAIWGAEGNKSMIAVEASPLIDIYAEASSITTTSAVLEFTTDASGGTGYQLSGAALVKDDLALTVDGATVAITTLTSQGNGKFVAVWPTQASGKVLHFTQGQSGRYCIKPFTVTIP